MTRHHVVDITVMIPTRAAAIRRDSLAHAVESVLGQAGVAVQVLLIINGAEAPPALHPSLQANPRVRHIVLAEPDLPAAYRAGIRQIDTAYFAALDDDDALLPGALKVRHSALERHPTALVAVTNGVRREAGRDVRHVESGDEIRRDPLRALLRRNWLLPGSWLCRTTPGTRAVFDEMPQHLECTYLGIRFSQLGMIWLDEPTVVYTVGSPHSVSRSREYVEAQADALRQILRLDLPPFARRELRPRVAAALHRAANLSLAAGSLRDAWRWHAATLREPGGWRYAALARHLLRATVRRAVR